MTELQRVVNSLGRQLGHAVALFDTSLALVAFSPHPEGFDDIRRSTILERRAPAGALALLRQHGLDTVTEPLRLHYGPSPIPQVEHVDDRVGAPVRCRGVLLGYLFVMNGDNGLTDADLSIVAESAELAGSILYRERLLREIERASQREVVRDLLAADDSTRVHAADRATADGLFTATGHVTTLVVQPHSDGALPGESVRDALGAAMERCRRLCTPGSSLHLVRADHAVFVVATDDPAVTGGNAITFGDRLLQSARSELSHEPRWKVHVGVGTSVPSLGVMRTSYVQAHYAARVAHTVAGMGDLVAWDDLGVYGMLAGFTVDRVIGELLPGGLLSLFAHEGDADLLETLETYLDMGCSVNRTSKRLGLHRASLYYRLRRIEEVSGVNLDDGQNRLMLHLGLKLSRLACVHPETARHDGDSVSAQLGRRSPGIPALPSRGG